MTILCLPRPRDWRFQIFENVRGGAAEFQRGFRGDGFDVRRAAHAVGAEDFSLVAHAISFIACGGMMTPTLSGSTLTSVTPDGTETSTLPFQIPGGFDVGQIHRRADLVGLQHARWLRASR